MSKCKYRKVCKLYDELSPTCSQNNGMYYDDLKVGCGKYRDLEDEDDGK